MVVLVGVGRYANLSVLHGAARKYVCRHAASRRGLTLHTQDGHFCSTLSHLQTLLDRVDRIPIEVSITHPGQVDYNTIQLIAEHSSQFRSLALMLAPGSFGLPLMDLPVLENLVLHSATLNTSVKHILQMVDERAPALHNLCLEVESPLDFPLTDVARYQFYYRLRSLYLATGRRGQLGSCTGLTSSQVQSILQIPLHPSWIFRCSKP